MCALVLLFLAILMLGGWHLVVYTLAGGHPAHYIVSAAIFVLLFHLAWRMIDKHTSVHK